MNKVDIGPVTYTNSNVGLEELLKDPTINNIYNDAVAVYKDSTDVNVRHKSFLNLRTKYDNHFFVFYCLADFYTTCQQQKEAQKCYEVCLQIYPLVDAYLNLAIIYQQQGSSSKAKNLIQEAIDKGLTDIRLYNMLGSFYFLDKDYYEAYRNYKKIIDAQHPPTEVLKSVYNNIGFSSSMIGRCDKALEYYQAGLALPVRSKNLDIRLLQNKFIIYDYMYELPSNLFQQYLSINKILETKYICPNEKSTDGKIRVGYISGDFRAHVCMMFMIAIFNYRNRAKFNVYCYANVEIEDATSELIKSTGVNWFNIFRMEDEKICELIQNHHIDILIDLAGHTHHNKLAVLSQKPAPIQITYLGYPNTTGLTNIDYRITDRLADPETTTQPFTEKLVYLPRCFLCFSHRIELEKFPIKYTPKDYITFGVTNKINKHNEFTFKAWAEILKRVPNSILFIKRNITSQEDTCLEDFHKLGVEKTRIRALPYAEVPEDYHYLYNEIDICLDTFPYSGTTTSCDSFMMGTPIVTYALPNRHCSNVTKSILINMGCPELVTTSMDEYIDCAVQLAKEPQRIVDYKQTIRDKFLALMDEKKFAREFDHLLEELFNEN